MQGHFVKINTSKKGVIRNLRKILVFTTNTKSRANLDFQTENDRGAIEDFGHVISTVCWKKIRET